MSQETGKLVRHSLELCGRSGRSLEQRAAVRWPWLAGLWLRLMARLSPESGLRQALLLRGVQNAFDALNRGDFEAVLLGYHPDVEFQQPPGLGDDGELGFPSTYRGHAGFRKFQADWRSGWGESLYEPQELIDLGDRFLVLLRTTAHGEASGVSMTQDMALLETLNKAGKIIREQRYTDHAEALKAAGLSE